MQILNEHTCPKGRWVKEILEEKHKDLMRRVFGADNLQAIYDKDDSAPDDYAVNKLIPYICGTKGVPDEYSGAKVPSVR